MPLGISDNGYPTSLTTINLDLSPLHLEANLIVNTRELKLAFGVGLIW